MSLDEIRKDIDAIDLQLRELLMQRFDCSARVAKSKLESGDITVYRPDREVQILEKLGESIPEDRRSCYLSVLRKIMEASRTYQYGMICEQEPSLWQGLIGDMDVPEHSTCVSVTLTKPDVPGSMAPILSMIGDCGLDIDQLVHTGTSEDNMASFMLLIEGDIADADMRRLLIQLSMESDDFKITRILS